MSEPLSASASWRSRFGFILAALSSAIGLGNIWRFPYVAGENGGGAFVLVYLLAVVGLGVPLLLAELTIGRHAQTDSVDAFRRVSPRAPWCWTGWLGVAASVAILSYYPVVAGWVASYLWRFTSLNMTAGQGGFIHEFRTLIADPVQALFWHGSIVAASVAIVALGVQRGIERASRILMPGFAALVLVLAGYGLSLEGAGRAASFLFAPDWHALLVPRTWFAAAGQAFFSIGLAMGILVTYGAYVSRNENLPNSAWMIALGDTAVALIAGLMIFPVVFTYGFDPAQGPTLVFAVLPEVFALMPGGRWLAALFFLLLLIAALTSCVALFEVLVALAIARLGWDRRRTAWIIGPVVFALGVPAALSYGVLAPDGESMPWLDRVDRWTSNLLLPLSGAAIALSAGWMGTRAALAQAAGLRSPLAVRWWTWALRWALPAIIGLILVGALLWPEVTG